MSEAVAARATFAGPAGPDLLRIPAEPARLAQAVQLLRQLADSLQRAGDALAGADDRHQERDGSTTSTVLGVARWNGRRLGKDAALLTELADAADHEAQLLGDLQHHDLPALRRRWEQARGDLLAAMRGAADAAAREQQAQREQHDQQQGQQQGQHGQHGRGQGDGHRAGEHVAQAEWHSAPASPAPDAHALMEQVDEQQVQQYADLFAQLIGFHVTGGGGHAGATMLEPRAEHAVTAYRQAVRGVLDEFAAMLQRVRQAERHLEERETFPATERDEDEQAGAVFVAGGGLVSAVPVLRELAKDLRTGAQALEHVPGELNRIAQGLRDGQLPDRARQHEPGEGFRQDWQRHFERRHARLRTVSDKVDDVLQRFQRLDEECARAIRAH